MKLEEIIKGIENGTININMMGHKLYTPLTDEYWGKYEPYNLLKILKLCKEDKQQEQVGVECMESVRERYAKGELSEGEYLDLLDFARDFLSCTCKLAGYNIRVFKDVEIGKCLFANAILASTPFNRCGVCGEDIFPYLYSENEIRFCHYNDKTFKKRCAGEYLNGSRQLTAEINVTEKLGFANFFSNEKLNQPNPKKFYDINYLVERDKLMQDCAKKNIGYCQCDDCSGYVYLSKDKTEVIVADQQLDSLDNDYDYQGDICFDVWSYRCADTAEIKKHIKTYDYLLEVDPDDIGNQYFEVDVKPGRYKIIHNDGGAENGIWTKIKLIEK